ncbi:phage major capsid protein [Methylomonas sp. CM2]|uniref:phage major capsid protein n=1 Tax=Methylomonas sp. CM2 TaxID=3417647 RepID=UPI003CEB98D4
MKNLNWIRGWLTLALVICASLFAIPAAFAATGPALQLSGIAVEKFKPKEQPNFWLAGLGIVGAASGSKLNQLREQHTELVNQANNLLEQTGSASWSKEKQAEFDSVMDQADSVKNQIDAHRRMQEEDRENNFKDIDDFKVKGKSEKSEARMAVDAFFRKKLEDRSPEEIAAIRNTMSTTTGSQGGYTVQTEIASVLIDALKDFGGMRREASQVTTAGGNDMSYPSSDGTAEVGELLTQNASSTSLDPSFGTVPVNAYKFGSKIIAIPMELLQDSAIDVEGFVFNRIRNRIGRVENQYFTTGTGTSQPNGIVTAASVGKIGTTGQTTSIIYDDLVDLEESIDYAYQEGGNRACWLISQALRKVVRKIKDTTGRPIWTPSYDAGIAGTKAEQLMGYDICINNDMPTPAANAKSLAFGDLSKYQIRDALDVVLYRWDDSAFTSKGQIGFMGIARAGGNLLDTAAVKLYQHSAT